MLILEYIDAMVPMEIFFDCYLSKYHQFKVDKIGVNYNFVLFTEKSICKIPNIIPYYATRIVDTERWGFVKNTTSIKTITDDMKEEYMIKLLGNPDNFI